MASRTNILTKQEMTGNSNCSPMAQTPVFTDDHRRHPEPRLSVVHWRLIEVTEVSSRQARREKSSGAAPNGLRGGDGPCNLAAHADEHGLSGYDRIIVSIILKRLMPFRACGILAGMMMNSPCAR